MERTLAELRARCAMIASAPPAERALIPVPARSSRSTGRGAQAVIPPRRNRKIQYDYDKAIYRQRNIIERLFCRIKDWRRIHTRYDRCAHTFMSAICIAATFIFWLNQ